MRLAEVGQREMRHLVHRDPVVAKLRFGHVGADDEANGGAAKAP